MGYSSGVMVPPRVYYETSVRYTEDRWCLVRGHHISVYSMNISSFDLLKMTPHVIFYINCCHFFFDFSRDKGKDKKQCVLAVMGRVWQVIISCFDSIHIFDVFGCLTLAYFGREISLYYCVRYELLTLHYHWVLQC